MSTGTKSELIRIVEGMQSEARCFRETARLESNHISPPILVIEEIQDQLTELRRLLNE